MDKPNMIQFLRVIDDPNLIVPARGTPGSAGLDIRARTSGVIHSRTHRTIPTGWTMSVPEGFYVRVAPRSGMAHNNGIAVIADTIDRDYRGEIKIILANLSPVGFNYEYNDRIAQLIVTAYCDDDVEEVLELPPTARGINGLGSTGRK